MNAKEVGKKALSRVKEATMAVVEDRLDSFERNREILDNYDQDMADARESQFRRDIKNTIMSYLELKVKDDAIMRLLAKYFHVTTIDEATGYIAKAKIRYSMRELEVYLKAQHMSDEEIDDFFGRHRVYQILKEDPKLLSLPAEKLYGTLMRKKDN